MKLHKNKKKWLSIFMVLAMSLTMLGISFPVLGATGIQAAFTTPTPRQVFGLGGVVEISGTAQGLSEVSITVRSEQDSLVFAAQPQVINGIFTTSFTLNANAAEGEYTISLSGLGLNEIKQCKILVSDLNVELHIASPAAGAEFEVGDKVEITGTAENVDYLALTVRNSSNGRVYVAQPAVNNHNFSCGFTLPEEALAGEYTIYITAYGMPAPQTSSFTVKSSSNSGGGGGGDDPGSEDILTITGDGVSRTVSYSLEELQDMNLTRTVLSVTSDRPHDLPMAVEGVLLRTLLSNAGINWSQAELITFTGTDGYEAEFTIDELFSQPRYIFPSKTTVEPIIALQRAEGSSSYNDMTDEDIPVMVYGQRAKTEQTLLWFVKRLETIEVKTNTPRKWGNPTALIVTPGSAAKVATQGGEVPSGSLIYLKHSSPIPKIYYTIDASNPNMDSDIFNLHGCGPDQGVEEPVEITGPTTIKAIAIGRGKSNSNIMSLNFTVSGAPSGGGGSGGSAPIDKTVDEENLKSELFQENGRTGIKCTLQPGTLNDIEDGESGNRLTIKAEDSEKDIDEVQTDISADIVNKAAEKQMLLGIDSQIGSYTLPLNCLQMEEAANSLGVASDKLSLKIVISKASQEDSNKLKNQLQTGQQILTDPIQFTVEIIAPNGEKIEQKYFGGTYVERGIALDDDVNAAQTTGAVWNEDLGKFLPLPTLFVNRNGKQYALILSPSNSLYTVIQSNKTFSDIQDSWAKSDIELLASKMLIAGKSDSAYEPKSNITRAEFATLLVRALGLEEGILQPGQFKDVDLNAWYAGSVATAVAKGIITGFEGQLFKPNNNITREEMAVMIVRAAQVAGIDNKLSAAEQETYLTRFGDHETISAWAGKDVALAAGAGIINGMPNGDFSPRNNADRAQSAVMLKRFLVYVNFIDFD